MSKGDFSRRNPDAHRESARLGGIRAHAFGGAHEWTSEEASEAGRKGGAATAAKGREYMAEIGRKGGKRAKCRHAEQVSVVVDAQPMYQCKRCGKLIEMQEVR